MDSLRSGPKGTAVLCLLLLGTAAPLPAQRPAGEIRLQVKDPSGAAMEASGKLRNLATGVVRSFQTDAQGKYAFLALPYARYRLEVSRSGFTTQTLPVNVQSAAPIARTVTMLLGTASAQIDVVAATPLPGGVLSLGEIPAGVQAATQLDMDASGALELSDLMNRRLSGVNINENQGNPFQPDLNYRGYTASPLLGTPQGVSVYMDGVRQNQPFGDVVSWDLMPRIAIAEVALIPGSNPMFGLNTLGGAVTIETKDGRSQPGTSMQASGGSFGRRAVEFEHGGSNPKGLHWYVAGNLFHEDGWRVASPSDVRQGFAKLGWQGAHTTVALSFAYADNALTGNGLQEQRLLARDYASGYTLGDVSKNRSPFFNLSLRHAATSTLTFSGNAYFRYIRADTVNPNLNTGSLDQSVYQPTAADQAALKAAGYSGYPASGASAANTPFPFWSCIAQALRLAEPAEKCDGVITSGQTRQNNYGLSGQATWVTAAGGRRNQLTAGSAWDRSSLSFQQATQFAYINPDYTLTPVKAFEDGTTNADGTPVDTRVNLHGSPQTWSLYATDTLAVGKAWSFTVSGRYNRTTIDNRDRINPGGGAGSLDGQYVFGRFNPAAGVTFSATKSLNLYASYSESSRAPTSIELGCADPNNPCNLPNALAGDPPLNQVVTRTIEAGVRGGQEGNANWSVGWFRGENRNDILFVASPQTGNGYFKNFGQTRRQGVEAHLNGRIGRIAMGGNYTFVRATYQSVETVDGSSNSTNDSASGGAPGFDGVMQIQPGDRIPLIPEHMLKAFADVQATRKLSVDLDFVAVSRSYARGNENNLSRPDGIYYLGPGSSPGYGVVNIGAHYQLHKRWELFAQINNLLDHHYYTAAQLGPTGFNNQGTFAARPFPAVDGNYPIVHATFYAPGAPLGAWGGIRFKF
ncbi:MAG: TonB-dependent receptor [Candidatus Solibacter sp.]|jgi:outer membrane receptor protein involved in Fe transport